MFRFKYLLLILVISLFWIQGELLAQRFPEKEAERLKAEQKIRERIEMLRMWKLLEALDLSTEQSEIFLPILNDFRKEQKELEKAKRESLKMLKEEISKEEMDHRKIEKILNDLEENRVLFEKKRENFLSAAKEVLSLEQQAKLVLFEERFAEHIKEMIKRVVKRRRGKL